MNQFMPVKSTTATPAKATTPRKRRTRKTTTTAAKSVAKVTTKKATPSPKVTTTPKIEQKKVTVTTFQSGKVVNKSTELVKPNAPLIQMRDYQRDITNRWNIHHYEMQELRKDFFRLVDFLTPYHNEIVKRVKALG